MSTILKYLVALVEVVTFRSFVRVGIDKDDEQTGEMLIIRLADTTGRIKAICYKENIQRISPLIKKGNVRKIFPNLIFYNL